MENSFMQTFMQKKVTNIGVLLWRTGILIPLLSCLFLVSQAQAGGSGGLWTMAGQSLENTRHQKAEHKISPSNVANLSPRWVVTTGENVSATPAVDGEFIYFPDWAGNLFKVDRKTGAVVWQHQISDYAGPAGNFSRTTPAIYGDLLIFGDQAGRQFAGANVIAVDKNTGDVVWVNHLGDHLAAIITQSATVHADTVYIGVASLEEAFAAFIPGYVCCTFRASMAALDVDTGALLWQTYVVPEGFSGNAIWGSAPAVDKRRDQVYVATGNNYSVPQSVLDCVAAAGDDSNAQRACLTPYPDNYYDSVLALDLKTGAVNWSNTVIPFDVWTVACLFGLPSCPNPAGPDFDFGQAPMLYSVDMGNGGKRTDMVGVGQKSGQFWSLDPDTGAIIWVTQVSPGGIAGGLMWGSANDGNLIYTSSANSEYKPWLLIDGSNTIAGIWSALDSATGEIIWQTANPAGPYNAGGPVTVANGVVYVCSQDPLGYMFALDAATGTASWSFESGGSCNGGAAVANGKVYWGSGYTSIGGPSNTPNNKIYAFELP
jgi:polyvinyl alcohol dehydrogenase (cytochrome)